MKPLLAALFCLAALHSFPEDASSPKELFRLLDNEAQEKIWKQPDEWRKEHPGQKVFEAWQDARVEQWGMDILKRYTELFKRYPDTPFIWQQKQSAQLLWESLNHLNKPEHQEYLDDWKVMWPGDNVIERRFYTSRLRELANLFPDKADQEKIARTLMAEYPVRREPYRALLSIARGESPDAYPTVLQEILESVGTPEKVKAYLRRKPEDHQGDGMPDALDKDEPYDYWSKRERNDNEIDHYEIRYAQLFACEPQYGNWIEREQKVAHALISEFPGQTRPYSQLFFFAGKRGEDLGAARAWLVAFAQGLAPDTVKTDLQEDFFFQLSRACYDNFWWAMDSDNPPAPGAEVKAWYEKYIPLWRTYLEIYSDFVESRLTCSKMDQVKRDALLLLSELSHVTAETTYRKHLETLYDRWLALPGWSEEERVKIRSIQLYAQAADVSATLAVKPRFKHPALNIYPPDVCERVTRTLMKEFPKQAEPYEDFLIIAKRNGTLQRPLLQEMLDSQAPASIKLKIRNRIGQLDRVGQPLELKGTATDGREIDIQKMKGRVVLIDFWATWCGPCRNEIPRMKSLYEKFHKQGFEIIGMNLDDKRETLNSFLEKNPSPWPQQRIASWDTFGINAIPTMWLVDKKGAVRDVSAREDLEQKIARLLAEP